MTEHIQLLDDLGAEFVRVAAEAERTSRRPSAQPGRPLQSGLRARTLAIALGIAALIGGGTYAVPATRAAVDGIADSFAGWVSGDSDTAPGRALEPGDNVPSWFSDSEGGEARLIAEADGVGLYVRRADSDEGPLLEIGLGEGVAMADTLEGWRQLLGHTRLLSWAPQSSDGETFSMSAGASHCSG
jgi:hypothetical protein